MDAAVAMDGDRSINGHRPAAWKRTAPLPTVTKVIEVQAIG
jgi:hypothetical protein